MTQVVEVPKDPSRSHPFRQKEVIEKVNEVLIDLTINQWDIQCINKMYNIKSKSEYFYQGQVNGSPPQYSQNFVKWIARQCNKDQGILFQNKSKVE